MNKIVNLLIVLLFLINFEFFAQEVVRFECHMLKKTYLIGEPIDFVLSAINITNDKVERTFQGLNIVLKDGNGNVIKYGARSNGFPSVVSLNIEPNDTIYWIFDLIDIYGQTNKLAPIYLYMPIGEYKLEMEILQNNHREQFQKIQFQIVEPLDNEAIVYKTFMDLVTRNHTPFDLVKTLEMLYYKFPNSVYIPFILMNLDACYDILLNDHQKALSIRNEIIEHYPFSVISIQFLNSKLKALSLDSERLELLNNIKIKVKGTLFEKIYEQKIKELKRQ